MFEVWSSPRVRKSCSFSQALCVFPLFMVAFFWPVLAAAVCCGGHKLMPHGSATGHLTCYSCPSPFPTSEKSESCLSVFVPTLRPDTVQETSGFLHKVPLLFLLPTHCCGYVVDRVIGRQSSLVVRNSFWSQTDLPSDLYCTTYFLLDTGACFFLSLSLNVVSYKWVNFFRPRESLHCI